MNKKVMALAVMGAFSAPTAALAQASNVQIYGLMYVEYGYAKQGAQNGGGQLVNSDLLQTPGTAIGFKGEEALGGGLSVWFQCESTADIRGGGTQNGVTASTVAGTATNNSGIFCGRNSAIGLKGSMGNLFVGNWTNPLMTNNPGLLGTNETGFLGTSFMLYGGSGSTNDASTPTQFERRQNNSINYLSPVWNGLALQAQVSTPQTAVGFSTAVSVGKPRAWGLGANYTNGPLLITANYDSHSNFNALGTAIKGTTDTGYMLGANYQFGPVKGAVAYTKRSFDAGGGGTGDGQVSAWEVAADWMIQGPHELKIAYARANSTTGSSTAGTVGAASGLLVFNAGAGATGGQIWEAEYLYWLSKRTRVSVGYAALTNDAGARYSLGGFTAPLAGQNQTAVGTSIKTTF